MATYEEAYKEFTTEMNAMGFFHHEDLYHKIVEHLGDTIHDRDGSLVACSDKAELAAIKKDFLIGTLKMKDGPKLDEVMENVCGAMGQSNRNKHTATFYYLLVCLLGKEQVFLNMGAGLSVHGVHHKTRIEMPDEE